MENGLLTFLDPYRGHDIFSLLLKMGLATIMAGFIGLERRRKRRPAGFRTHILVCVGAALSVTTNIFLYKTLSVLLPSDIVKFDVARLGAQVINGIGFLGAGTMIVTGKQQVRGLTTAAGLWASACMGLAIGAGYYECAVLACFCIYITITYLNSIEKVFADRSQNMNVSVIINDMQKAKVITDSLKDDGVELYDVEVANIKELATESPMLIIEMRLPKRGTHNHYIAKLAKIDGIISVKEL
ncbi:MAG: MgtC/SapB family protein [Clostridia bacterium]|nr:MgtC/SapB family protein [Clostridia bacterium]